MDIVGMTAIPEAKLAREAEMCYCLISMVTDHDAWHETEEPVTAEMIFGYLGENTQNAKKILGRIITALPDTMGCSCGSSLAQAMVTDLAKAPAEAIRKLRPILSHYLL